MIASIFMERIIPKNTPKTIPINPKKIPKISRIIEVIIFRRFEKNSLISPSEFVNEEPSSVITLKQGVQNLLTHYIPDVKQVEAI